MNKFEVKTERLSASETRVVVVGELDLAAAPTLEGAIKAAFGSGFDSVFVDLELCSFIDSTGLATLVNAGERHGQGEPAMEAAARSITLVGARDQVRRVIDIVALDGLLPSFETLEEARTRAGGVDRVDAAP